MYLPAAWRSQRVVLRFESAHYYAIAYVNGHEVVRHDGGHLPFEAELDESVWRVGKNVVVVAVNNTLKKTTLPPGEVHVYRGDPRVCVECV